MVGVQLRFFTRHQHEDLQTVLSQSAPGRMLDELERGDNSHATFVQGRVNKDVEADPIVWYKHAYMSEPLQQNTTGGNS